MRNTHAAQIGQFDDFDDTMDALNDCLPIEGRLDNPGSTESLNDFKCEAILIANRMRVTLIRASMDRDLSKRFFFDKCHIAWPMTAIAAMGSLIVIGTYYAV